MNTLAEWTKRVSAELELDPDTMDQTVLLDLAKEAAHNVARPAAPLTTFLVGVAVGRGLPLAEAAAKVTAMAASWSDDSGLQTESNPK
ncbi:DUF6457 domain-containing protein [Fodinicola acaciae]|uniref:DUF6457 domain-containing protein n=1 Tax=Fodinicola acaciae TaxID=2681555 RepID=UPI0013D66D61|nr:DUF6457 domain-containing protein [Fodinicola acaciae]